MNQFRIPFVGLKPGLYGYDFELENEFFEEFETSEVSHCNIKIHVDLERRENMLNLQIGLKGTVETLCDRCQEALTIPLDHMFELVVKFGEERGHTDEEILVLGPQDHELDLAQHFYEYLHLALPSRRVHTEPEGCDERILAILDEHAYGSDDDDEESDPRWAALKKLKDNKDPE